MSRYMHAEPLELRGSLQLLHFSSPSFVSFSFNVCDTNLKANWLGRFGLPKGGCYCNYVLNG